MPLNLKKLLLPSIGDALFVGLIVRVLTLGDGLLNDADTGWHIAAGNIVLDTHALPHADVFSHTAFGRPWTMHGWLFDVMATAAHRAAGLNGVACMAALIIGATFLLLYRTMRAKGAGPLVSAAFTLLAASASSAHMLARPHIFTMLFTLAFFALLETHRERGGGRVFLLPMIMLMWVNVHPGFMTGILMTALYLAGAVFSRDRARARTLAAALALTLLAAVINPHGFALLAAPFDVAGKSFVTDNLVEWASADFHRKRAFELLLLLVFSILALARKKPVFEEWALVFPLFVASLMHVRFIPLFAVVVATVAAARAADALEAVSGAFPSGARAMLERLSHRAGKMGAGGRGHLWPVVFSAVVLAIALNGGQAFGCAVMSYSFDGKDAPTGAMDFLLKEKLPGRMLNRYGWGGYVIYRGYPQYRVFIDGRVEPFGEEIFRDYLEVERAGPGMELVLDKYRVDWALLDTDGAACRLLVRKGWRAAYCDGTASVLVRPE